MGRRGKSRQQKAEEFAVLVRAVESTNEGFVTIDEDHKVIFFNRAAERLFGYRREQVLGRDLDVILAPECSPDHRRAVERYLGAKRPRPIGHARELTARRKDGSTFPCHISFSVARRKGRVFFTGIVRDHTDTKTLQEQIVQAERLAALGQTVAEIIHEIQNPMVIIGGFVRQLSRATKEPKTQGKLDLIASEVRRVEKLLAELRDLYLPKPLRKRTFDLGRMLGEVHSLARQAVRDKNVRLGLDTRRVAIYVRGDREKLKQVFFNVIKNGIEAVGDEGSVETRATVHGDRVRVEIRDDGTGISDEHLSRVFSPFFTTKRNGTGLGLCISKRIIDEHGDCTLELDTEQGRGTTVKISLPRRPPPGAKAGLAKKAGPPKKNGKGGRHGPRRRQR